jgi:DNA-binding protein H-NS
MSEEVVAAEVQAPPSQPHQAPQEYMALAQELDTLESRRAAIQEAIAERKEAAKIAVVDEIRAHIAAYGFPLEEILTALAPKGFFKSAGKPAKGSKAPVVRNPAAKYRDKATGNIFSRGRVPDWMVAAMTSVGIDPTAKDAVKQYKAAYMEVV